MSVYRSAMFAATALAVTLIVTVCFNMYSFWLNYKFFQKQPKTSEVQMLSEIYLGLFITSIIAIVIPGVPSIVYLALLLANMFVSYQYFAKLPKQDERSKRIRDILLALFIILLLCIPTPLTFFSVPFAIVAYMITLPVLHYNMMNYFKEIGEIEMSDAYRSLFILETTFVSIIAYILLLIFVKMTYAMSFNPLRGLLDRSEKLVDGVKRRALML